MNKVSATEWLKKFWHNLSAAQILYNAKHYEDIIAVEVHYSVEKSMKGFLAFFNKKIPKSHDLVDIYELIKEYINLEDYLKELIYITDYHIKESYPTFDRTMPKKEELKEALAFAEELFIRTCNILDLDIKEIKNK